MSPETTPIRVAGTPTQVLARVVDRVLLLSGSMVTLSAALAVVIGGGVWRLGPLSIRMQRPFRSLAIGVALLLLREALRLGKGGLERLRFLVLLAALVTAVAVDSEPRIVGDGSEYVAMAWNLSRGRPPALNAEERGSVEAVLALRPGELSDGRERLLGSDGRQDFHHFWLYSLVVAPPVAAMGALGRPLVAFTLANALLLVIAAAVVHRRAGSGPTLVLFGGPLLWWLDKPHPEVFLVALLSVALALARERPEAALPLVGLSTAQNPVFAVVLAVGSVWALVRGKDRAFLVPSVVGSWALASANPLYYLARLARPVPLRDTILLHLPNTAELRAVLVDPNLGLLVAWPSLALAALLAIAISAKRGGSWPWWDLVALGSAIVALLFLFTQPGNVNHGGTRGMSRYALWLAPFVVPALVRLGAAGPRAIGSVAVLGGLSLLSTIPEYLPARPERYLEPTRLAAWLWTRHPGLDRPLPEVFAERAWGYPPQGSVPASMPGCETALVRGDGTAVGLWPLSCMPAAKPEWCRETSVLCYAAAGPNGYAFARAPRQPTFFDRHASRWCWGGTPTPELAAALRRLPWKSYGLVAVADEGVFIERRFGVGGIELRTAPGSFLVWIGKVRKGGAWIAPVVHAPSTGILIDPVTGAELSRASLGEGTSGPISLPFHAPLLLLVGADP